LFQQEKPWAKRQADEGGDRRWRETVLRKEHLHV